MTCTLPPLSAPSVMVGVLIFSFAIIVRVAISPVFASVVEALFEARVTDVSIGAAVSTVSVAVDAEDALPAASRTKSLYVPAVAGALIDVAVPPAVVMVDPAAKDVVPDGASQTALDAVPEEVIVIEALAFFVVLVANTASWLVGAVLSKRTDVPFVVDVAVAAIA